MKKVSDAKRKVIETVLAPYSFGKIEDMITMVESILTRGVTIEELQQYIVDRKKEYNAALAAIPEGTTRLVDSSVYKHPPVRSDPPVTKKCPECGNRMFLRQVTRPEGRQNIHGYKSAWECSQCPYEIYSKKSAQEENLLASKE